MIDKERIEPHKVTKPIQLLAAWLVGLIFVDSCFLVAAVKMAAGNWERSALVLAAIANVPIFLVALFLLQTKFRPELQEDIYYSQYLDKKTDKVITLTKHDAQASRLLEIKEEMSTLIKVIDKSKAEFGALRDRAPDVWKWDVAINDHLDSFPKIRQELKKNNIPVKSIFGKINGTKRPGENIISFDAGIDFQSLLKLLRILSQFDFDGYIYGDSPKEVDPEDVYIGTYGYANAKIIPFSEELKELLKADIDEIDLKYLEQKSAKKNA